MKSSIASLLAMGGPAMATVLWDGSFTSETMTQLAEWSWSNQVGPYQYYIHGTDNATSYIDVGTGYGNPGESSTNQGAKISLTTTSYWNNDGMLRTELIPSTKEAINKGKKTYHFSMMRKTTNAPVTTREHQIAFFESHFCEMMYGWLDGETGTTDTNLQFYANSKSQWKTTWEAGIWYNFAYEIDFSGDTVAFWQSTGSEALTKVVDAVSVTASSDGADWHVGVLELPRTGYNDTDEDFYFANVYIEDGDVTTAVGSTSSSSSSSDSSSDSSSSSAAATSAASTSAAATSAAATTSEAATSAAATTSEAATSAAATTSAVATTLSTVVASSTSAADATTAVSTTSTSSAAAATKTKCLRRRRYRKGVPKQN